MGSSRGAAGWGAVAVGARCSLPCGVHVLGAKTQRGEDPPPEHLGVARPWPQTRSPLWAARGGWQKSLSSVTRGRCLWAEYGWLGGCRGRGAVCQTSREKVEPTGLVRWAWACLALLLRTPRDQTTPAEDSGALGSGSGVQTPPGQPPLPALLRGKSRQVSFPSFPHRVSVERLLCAGCRVRVLEHKAALDTRDTCPMEVTGVRA